MARSLFVIIDPTQDEQPALSRAAALLGESGGHIHAFCCIYEEDFSAFSSRRDGKRALREQARERVEGMLAPLQSGTTTTKVEIYWNDDWSDSAVQACARTGADFLLKSTFSHRRGSHILSKRSDYHILRHSPCPVLLSKTVNHQPYRRALAAVALEDNDERHEHLNNRVIAQAQRICRYSGAELHAVTALEGAPNIAQLLKITEDEDEEKLSGEQMISQRYGIDMNKIHIDYGPAKSVIEETAKAIGADLLIIGTIARRGVSGAIVGNTAEKVLDNLGLDILAVS
ncbi:universal stress protein [Gilvimarinus sp. F26214L]|uniref:universal stress protein n=1 Tax=Gilvimarinus sp. DZF01 TaxID=3461371 RepID=UPI0040467112